MMRTMLKSKIHRATVTEAELHYEGSITIDEALIEAAELAEYEQVHIYNVDSGARFSTYVIPGPRNSGIICLNGAAARLVAKGDKIIIACYASFDEKELASFKPALVYVDDKNRIKSVKHRIESESQRPRKLRAQ